MKQVLLLILLGFQSAIGGGLKLCMFPWYQWISSSLSPFTPFFCWSISVCVTLLLIFYLPILYFFFIHLTLSACFNLLSISKWSCVDTVDRPHSMRHCIKQPRQEFSSPPTAEINMWHTKILSTTLLFTSGMQHLLYWPVAHIKTFSVLFHQQVPLPVRHVAFVTRSCGYNFLQSQQSNTACVTLLNQKP